MRSSSSPSSPWQAGRYQPLAELGRGRLGDVVLAKMRVGRDLKRLVVLRRMWPELARQANLVSMFLRRARIGGRLEHPNIPRTYEILDDGERPLVALEYLDGQRLSNVLQRFTTGSCPLPLAARLPVVLSVLEALEYAHGAHGDGAGVPRGVVHRDVSARNVVVTYDGKVKLVDFGLARSRAAAYDHPGRTASAVHYLAPEQARGGPIDHRTDLFAAGILLWELSAGQRLWDGMTEDEILRHLMEGLPIRALPSQPDLPSGLVSVCARALASDPDDRYESASDFADDIEQAIWRADLSGGRVLGEAVSVAFARERAARAKLIERGERKFDGRASLDEAPWQQDEEDEREDERVDAWEGDGGEEVRQPPRAIRRPLPVTRARPVSTAVSTDLELRRTTIYVPRKPAHQVRWMAIGFATAVAAMAGTLAVRGALSGRRASDGPAIVARSPAPQAEPHTAKPSMEPAVLNALVADKTRVERARPRPRPARASAPVDTAPVETAPVASTAAVATDGARGGSPRAATALRPLDKSDPFTP